MGMECSACSMSCSIRRINRTTKFPAHRYSKMELVVGWSSCYIQPSILAVLVPCLWKSAIFFIVRVDTRRLQSRQIIKWVYHFSFTEFWYGQGLIIFERPRDCIPACPCHHSSGSSISPFWWLRHPSVTPHVYRTLNFSSKGPRAQVLKFTLTTHFGHMELSHGSDQRRQLICQSGVVKCG